MRLCMQLTQSHRQCWPGTKREGGSNMQLYVCLDGEGVVAQNRPEKSSPEPWLDSSGFGRTASNGRTWSLSSAILAKPEDVHLDYRKIPAKPWLECGAGTFVPNKIGWGVRAEHWWPHRSVCANRLHSIEEVTPNVHALIFPRSSENRVQPTFCPQEGSKQDRANIIKCEALFWWLPMHEPSFCNCHQFAHVFCGIDSNAQISSCSGSWCCQSTKSH